MTVGGAIGASGARSGQLPPWARWRVLVLTATAFAIGAPVAGAQAATITFDDLTPPATVNNQYADQGVTFNNPTAIDYSAFPGFAHSGNVAVEPCVGIEFCTSPVQATFTTAQQDVGVWVGYSFMSSEPVGVRLTAFDGSDAVVGTDDASLPVNAARTPIDTHLTVSATPAQIVKIEVSVTTGGGYTGALAVDDVEFSTAGPPPACNATSAPEITLTQPPSNRSVQFNEFLLQGQVSTGGAPITAASIIAHRPATDPPEATRTSSVYPVLIDSDGGALGPIRVNGLLHEGVNDVTVTATNCMGTGTSDGRRLIFGPLPPTTEIHQLGVIEVTQSVQTDLNSVGLVAASPNGVKRTFARVYLQPEGTNGLDLTHVTGTLSATRPDGSRPPGPLTIPSINPPPAYGYISSTDTPEQIRSRLSDPLIFELPREWLASGRLHLQLDKVFIQGIQSTYPCVGCENLSPIGVPPVLGPSMVNFHRVPSLRLWLVSMPYRPSPGATPVVPSQSEIDTVASLLRRMFPADDFQVMQATMPIAENPPGTCVQAKQRVVDWGAAIAAQDPQAKFMGMLGVPSGGLTVEDNDGNRIGGCADVPGRYGWAKSGQEYTAMHELGHMFGRRHVQGCALFPGSSFDGLYPHPSGVIGSDTAGDALGLDAGDAALGAGMELLDWRDGITDLMTYCDDQWISEWNYRNILGALCRGELSSCPDSAGIIARSAIGAAAATRSAASGGKRLQVLGTLRGPGRASLSSIAVFGKARLSPRPKQGRFAIALRGSGGRTLARYPIDPAEIGEESARAIDEIVPFEKGTRRISITSGKKAIASRRVSAHAPTVSKVSVKTGKGKAKGRIRVRWRSKDRDGGKQTYTLLYTGNGRDFVPVAGGIRKRSLAVKAGILPGGSKARFRVIASDGVLTGSATSRRLRVPAKSPRVRIVTPAKSAVFTAGQVVQLVASVQDLQDVPFRGSRVVWKSSVQGNLGSGTSIAVPLSAGNHTITATATNSKGKKKAATVKVDVEAVPPVFDAAAAEP